MEIAEAVLPVLSSIPEIEVASCELTDVRMYIKVTTAKIQAEVRPGDVVQAGLVISNSEIGAGAVRVEPLVYRLVCTNGMIANDFAHKKYHVGRQAQEGDAYEIYRDETLQADDRAFLMKVQDTVKAAMDQTKFQMIVDRMKLATTQMIEADPVTAVEVTRQKFGLTQADGSGIQILKHLIMGQELSAYGLLNAITRHSQDVDSYDYATDLERVGGKILDLSKAEWKEIAHAGCEENMCFEPRLTMAFRVQAETPTTGVAGTRYEGCMHTSLI